MPAGDGRERSSSRARCVQAEDTAAAVEAVLLIA
jgi:hypothetical protein